MNWLQGDMNPATGDIAYQFLRRKNMIIRTGCCKKLPFIFALLAVAVLAATSSAQTCLKDEYGKNVQCTANDVRVAFADNIRALDGTALTSCTAGSTFSFVADFHVVTTATARENIGLYFQTAGGANALTGTCSDNIIAPKHTAVNPLDKVQLGSSDYFENTSVDQAGDTCGDITTAHNNQTVTVEVDNAKCVAGTNGMLALPDCTSWQQPGGTILCQSSSPSYPWVPAAVPGSPSKCNCDNGFTVPIQVQSPSVSIAKSCTTAISTQTNPPLTSCDAGEEGGSVTYTVSITNSSNFGDIIVDQICDNVYGTVFRAGSPFSGPACATAGSISAANTTCGALDIPSSNSGTCTFTVTQGENSTVKNIVSVTGHGGSAGTFGPQNSNEVTVVSSDAPSTATTTKSFVSNRTVCATVRYGASVHNSSGPDEALTLSALSDSAFGSITTTHGDAGTNNSVLGTTCGVVDGLGTLAGTGNGAGAFNQTLAVGGTDYSCQFDGVICGTPGTLTGGSCSTGFTHVNTVTPTLTGDEGETVTNSGGALTVTECVSGSGQ
jgi:hypothetical protein